MALSGDLIDFGAIETHKENIQSLPGGRSAKQLSLLCSPLSANESESFTQSQDLKNTIRQDFEKELEKIDESDDPLEVYDRYVKWTTNAYPTAQATSESGLLPLIEQATRSLLTNTTYKNDPRYLKIWLLYIRLFADSPREIYAFLAKHEIGEKLALYYEEFAAWLEGQGHWTQADQVFGAGVDKEARPKERLLRKYAEFQHRRETKATTNEGPSSPALPRLRAALAARTEGPVSADPQADDRINASLAAARPGKAGRAKMAIFSDSADSAAPHVSTTFGQKGPAWESIGSAADRKKENAREPTSWAGETLDGGRKMAEPKMSVFKDPTLAKLEIEMSNPSYVPNGLERLSYDAKGRRQYVFAKLEDVYPNGVGHKHEEFCFEELRARHRGWLQKSWADSPKRPVHQLVQQHEAESTCHLNLPRQSVQNIEPLEPLVDLSDENMPPHGANTVTVPLKGSPGAAEKRARREEMANKTRKIKIVQVEVKQEAQTIQLNLDSPSGPTKVRKKKPEATMTIHTKEAMNEVYDIFNQPLESNADIPAELDPADSDSDDADEVDYTSAGESTGTGRISAGVSEYGDDTTGDFTTSSRIDVEADSLTQNTISDTEYSDYTNTNTNTSGILNQDDEQEDLSKVSLSAEALIAGVDASQGDDDEHAYLDQAPRSETPTSPEADLRNEYDDEQTPAEMGSYIAPAYRVGKAAGRLPFMTPIVEKTESSLGALTAAADRSFACLKTPSRQNVNSNNHALAVDSEDDDDDFQAGLLSSPFQENTEPLSEPADSLAQANPVSKLTLRPKTASLENGRLRQDEIIERKTSASINLVPDSQCNPIDAGIRALVLGGIDPPLSSFKGFSDWRGTTSGMSAKIRRYTKSANEKRNGADTTSLPPVLDFDQCPRTYTVRRELGRGAFAPVYLVDSAVREASASVSSDECQRGEQEVIKMEDPPTPWEFYIISEARRRLSSTRGSQSIVKAHEMHMFDDEGYLIEDFRNQGTLLDAINICRADGAMDELLVMFFTVELFRTLEALHAAGIIHGDVKPDNILIRFDDTEQASQFSSDGTSGWAEKGILLIDFGRGIDMRAFKPDVQFIADWKTTDADCAEMREMRPWTFQVDYHGLAGTVHSLLFGKYMETVVDRGTAVGAGASKIYKIKEGLKRYWQTDIWTECFDVLLNPLMHVDAEENRALPVVRRMQQIRQKMETHLTANCEKGVGLKPLIRRLDAALKERRK